MYKSSAGTYTHNQYDTLLPAPKLAAAAAAVARTKFGAYEFDNNVARTYVVAKFKLKVKLVLNLIKIRCIAGRAPSGRAPPVSRLTEIYI
eukprot:SAG31_NODE_1335_length_8749_cov_3.813426_1_plen_90_part_00